ncbi:4-hydroxyphenylacetate 3-monooxygenase, reductase component [Arthrobacter mobilis]|uniref:4-hydroxyphenylacetate 3-monooxygenase reductase component n=1 Tax=Arthrobacter mobilis TaxID=2724944 RepID=A0A7X6K4N1_9MICC|nr:4-hydroxyphenylacetate 3-monooxygenase, reductase component [Arthrobacter mobilis]NKX55522.1 4-hydroxyphenylacetate 3-monooxygenase, reductase component [Arthrobacter mobilis]
MPELSQIQKTFRTAMAHLPAAVNIVTTDGPHGRLGLTVSAVCSVTDSPPTVLVCVNQSSAAHDIFSSNGEVCINVLSGDHEELARHFAGMTKVPMAERFGWDIWEEDAGPVPVLRDALVKIVGRISDRTIQGSHSVYFVEVDRVDVRDELDGLIYFNRGFHRIGAAPKPLPV